MTHHNSEKLDKIINARRRHLGFFSIFPLTFKLLLNQFCKVCHHLETGGHRETVRQLKNTHKTDIETSFSKHKND